MRMWDRMRNKMRWKSALLISVFLLIACQQSKDPAVSGLVSKAPAELTKGEALFRNYCARCHGEGARGTDHGPPFLSKIYEPNHHGDSAFQLAPLNGVRAHHWNFGDMPKVEGIKSEEIQEIIPYIRWIQKEAGVY